MKIYVGHSSSYNYVEDLYKPIQNSELWGQHQFILPHAVNSTPVHSKELILTCELFIAEVSYPSTGLGIELGWASDAGCKILCIAKEDAQPSSSVNMICANIIRYTSSESLIVNLNQWLTVSRPL